MGRMDFPGVGDRRSSLEMRIRFAQSGPERLAAYARLRRRDWVSAARDVVLFLDLVADQIAR